MRKGEPFCLSFSSERTIKHHLLNSKQRAITLEERSQGHGVRKARAHHKHSDECHSLLCCFLDFWRREVILYLIRYRNL